MNFWSHKFLETFGKPLTVIEFRKEFKAIDVNFDKRMCMLEYLLYEFKHTVDEILARPPGTTPELTAALEAYAVVEVELLKIEKEKNRLRKEAKGTGVKAKAAANTLAQMETAELPPDLLKAVVKAESQVKRAQSKIGAPAGSVWWLDRDIQELKKYKPKGK